VIGPLYRMIVPQSGGDNSDVSVDTDSDDEDGEEGVDNEDSDDEDGEKGEDHEDSDDKHNDGTDYENSDDEEVEATQTWPEGSVLRPFGY